MTGWLLFGITALAFALVAAWMVRRLLDAEISWPRALITSLVVFGLCTPLAVWSLTAVDVYVDGQIVVGATVAVAFLALTLGWIFAVVVVVVLTLEFLWPSRGFRNPIVLVREALQRRDRARRYAQILAIGSRHGLGLYESRRRGRGDDLPTALVAAMNEAGVTFVKLGQVLSSREDLLPREMIDALSTLQMDSTPLPWAEAEAAIAAQLRRPIAEVFAEIDEVPLAAASVAQVHAARLLDGDEVVVKIQRPAARAQVTTDLDILERLAADAERYTDWAKEYGARALVAEFARALREELDYHVEVANTEMLRGALAASASPLRVPWVYKELSTAQLIVQERAIGTPFSRLDAASLRPGDGTAIADTVMDSVFDQIAVRGIFHADLHAGNLILGDDGAITLIDFGAVGVIERSLRRLLVPLLVAMANEDDVAVTDIALLMCAPARGSFDVRALQRDIGVILTRVHNTRMNENIFRLFIEALRTHRMALPPALLLVFRTLASLEGTLRRAAPDYDMVGRALELAPRVALTMVTPRSALLTVQTWSALIAEQARRMPRRVESITRSLDEGTLSVRLRSFESKDERSWVDGIVGRLTTILVGITLVVTGIILSLDGGGPMITSDVAVFAFLGSVLGLGGLLLLLRTLRTALRGPDRYSRRKT